MTGRYAGKKAVIVRNYDDGTNARPYGHALVVGLSKYPRKVTKRSSEKTREKRSKTRLSRLLDQIENQRRLSQRSMLYLPLLE